MDHGAKEIAYRRLPHAAVVAFALHHRECIASLQQHVYPFIARSANDFGPKTALLEEKSRQVLEEGRIHTFEMIERIFLAKALNHL